MFMTPFGSSKAYLLFDAEIHEAAFGCFRSFDGPHHKRRMWAHRNGMVFNRSPPDPQVAIDRM
jgi:hypothetical protein